MTEFGFTYKISCCIRCGAPKCATPRIKPLPEGQRHVQGWPFGPPHAFCFAKCVTGLCFAKPLRGAPLRGAPYTWPLKGPRTGCPFGTPMLAVPLRGTARIMGGLRPPCAYPKPLRGLGYAYARGIPKGFPEHRALPEGQSPRAFCEAKRDRRFAKQNAP